MCVCFVIIKLLYEMVNCNYGEETSHHLENGDKYCRQKVTSFSKIGDYLKGKISADRIFAWRIFFLFKSSPFTSPLT